MKTKPKILIIADVPGWAMDHTAHQVIRHLRHRYQFEKAFNRDAFHKIPEGNFDLLYITYETQLQDAGLELSLPPNSVTGVRCHVKWDGGCGLPPSTQFLAHLQKFRALNVPSLILHGIFSVYHPAVFHTPHGVDIELFRPGPFGPLASPSGQLVLGWTGSRTNHPGKRGIEDYILPALKGLAGITFLIAAREDKWRSHVEMADFYRSLDAYICASRVEGGPHPLLEASACGLPVISTAVGIAPELIDSGRNGILVERDVASLREAIVRLRDDRDLRLDMGRQARKEVVERWTWEIQAQKYIPFFDYGLNPEAEGKCLVSASS